MIVTMKDFKHFYKDIMEIKTVFIRFSLNNSGFANHIIYFFSVIEIYMLQYSAKIFENAIVCGQDSPQYM